jgi:hypothetical protein
MMSLFFRCCLTAALLAQLAAANAEVMYQCVDDLGRKTFSNVKLPDKDFKCVTLDIGPATAVPTVPAVPVSRPAAKSPSPPGFPKVEGTAQKERDNDRQRILEDELAVERRNLEQAKKELAAQESIRSSNERNYERTLDYKNKVAQHERNVEALENELDRLR